MHELAKSLERYFDATDALFYETWASSERLCMRQVRRLVEDNEEFREVFERCGCIQASRLLEGSTRLLDTTTNRALYAANPKIAALVLGCKHGYVQKTEVSVEQSNKPTAIDTLRQQMPTDEVEARRWLERVAAGAGASDGARELQGAAEFLLGEYEMKDMVEVGSALCDF